MRLLLLALAATLLMAGEADPKVQVKAVWLAAGKSGDAWTCLQAEAWARSRKPAVRLGSMLGESTYLGDPLLTWPEPIQILADFADRILVTTPGRAWLVAPDGRPLQSSIKIPESWYQTVGYEGEALGVVARHQGNLQLTALRLLDGSQPVKASIPVRPTQSLGDGRVVADDGSAIAVEVDTRNPETGRTLASTIVASATLPVPRQLEMPAGLLGIGRNASWVIGGSAPNHLLVVGDRRRTLTQAAVGPGIAVGIDEGRLQLIHQDGSESPLVGAPALSTEPSLATVGTWLVFASGWGAKTVSDGDLLGEGGGVEAEQPPTLAFWRWSDLATDASAKPVATMRGELSVSRLHPAAVWNWLDKQLDLIDLSGPQPRREAFITVESPINWVSTSLDYVRLHHPAGQSSLYGLDKRLVWMGACNDIDVMRRDLALVYRRTAEHHAWSLVSLSADPAMRKEVHLDLPDVQQRVWVSARPPDRVVAQVEGNAWRSLGFDGKVIASNNAVGPLGVPRPECPEWNWYYGPGRFYRDGVFVRSKATLLPEDPMATLDLADAWSVGSTNVLLQQSGRVLMNGRKRGEWIDLPAVAPADRLAMAGSAPVIAAGEELRSVAAIAPGPKLEPRPPLGVLADMPSGPWRIEGNRFFTPPRGRQMEWDVERVGWRPHRLRSPEGSGLFVITPGVLIELDPAAAKLFGK